MKILETTVTVTAQVPDDFDRFNLADAVAFNLGVSDLDASDSGAADTTFTAIKTGLPDRGVALHAERYTFALPGDRSTSGTRITCLTEDAYGPLINAVYVGDEGRVELGGGEVILDIDRAPALLYALAEAIEAARQAVPA